MRWSARRKEALVLRLLRGESLDLLGLVATHEAQGTGATRARKRTGRGLAVLAAVRVAGLPPVEAAAWCP